MSEQSQPWNVSLSNQTVSHESGFSISFTGVPGTSAFEGTPSSSGKIPNLEFIALLREGFQQYEDAYVKQNGRPKSDAGAPSGRKPVITKKPSRKRLMENRQ